MIDLFGMVQAPGVNFLAMAIKHSVHHRGQLSTYLRAMGGKVPGIYDPALTLRLQPSNRSVQPSAVRAKTGCRG
ncbi:MAG: DinB family protein [Vicinamibacterales bacterium]